MREEGEEGKVLCAVFSLEILVQYAFSTDLWKWGRAKNFDLKLGSTQAPPSQYAFILDLGRTHCLSCVVPKH